MADNQNGMAAEYERVMNKTAKDIHDNILQISYLIKMQLDVFLDAQGARVKDAAALRYAIQLVSQLIADANKICLRLNNDFILSNNLSTLLQFDMERICRTMSIDFHYQQKGDVKVLDPQLKSVIYRIAIEAVENAIKHSVAANIWININFKDHGLIMEIKDDGCGFATDKLHVKETIGLPYMYQRAKLLNAELNIDSVLGTGSKITLNCPC
ncbi:sensor histidine kinase [Mucilaginibacter sp.]